LTDLPAFYVLPVDVAYQTEDKTENIRSQRLRYKAIREFIQESGLKHSKHRISIRIENSKDPKDEIIMSSVNGESLPAELDILQTRAFELLLPTVRFYCKANTYDKR
jgi:hypothetical protein